MTIQVRCEVNDESGTGGQGEWAFGKDFTEKQGVSDE